MADNTVLNTGTGGDTIASDDIGGVKFQRIKLVHGADGVNAGDVSTANPLPIYGPDATATGTITVTDSVVAAPGGAGVLVSGASTAGSLVAVQCLGGDSAWNVQITGLTTGTLYFEGSLDSTNGTDGNWINVNGRQTGIVNTVLAGNSTTNGIFRGNTSGLLWFRVRSVGALTGTPAIRIRVSDGTGAIFLNASVPAGTNNIGDVDVLTLPALVAGAALIGKVGIDQTTVGTTNAVSVAQVGATAAATGNGVAGAGVLRVAIASDNTAYSVNATPPTLTKATQGATGYSTQDLKDAGRSARTIFLDSFAVAAATETLMTMSFSSDNGTPTTGTSYTVTAAKRLRIQCISAGLHTIAGNTTAVNVIVRIRTIATAPALVGSPIQFVLPIQGVAAANQAGMPVFVDFPDGWEIPAGAGLGVTVTCSGFVATTAAPKVDITINAYEY